MALLPKNKTIRWNFILSSLINLAIWFFLYWQVEPRVEPLALRYNIYFGINLIGPWWHVFWWPVLGLLFIVINFSLAKFTVKKNYYLAYFLAYSSTLTQTLLAAISVFAVMING